MHRPVRAAAVAETKNFVDVHWAEITAVAEALLKSFRLTESEVLEIIYYQARRGTRNDD
jgi:hypothetical protein